MQVQVFYKDQVAYGFHGYYNVDQFRSCQSVFLIPQEQCLVT